MVDSVLTQEKIYRAIAKVSEYPLRESLNKALAAERNHVDRVHMAIWPVIQELVLLADACEAGMLVPTPKKKNM